MGILQKKEENQENSESIPKVPLAFYWFLPNCKRPVHNNFKFLSKFANYIKIYYNITKLFLGGNYGYKKCQSKAGA